MGRIASAADREGPGKPARVRGETPEMGFRQELRR